MQPNEEPKGQRERLCLQCALPIPRQKTGRPRKYCSQSCRQQAYEDRHGLAPWTERHHKDDDGFAVLEDNASRKARNDVRRQLARATRKAEHDPEAWYVSKEKVRSVCFDNPELCIEVVVSDPGYCAVVLDHLSEVIWPGKFPADHVRWDFCVQSMLRLRSYVDLVTGATPSDPIPSGPPPAAKARKEGDRE
ncbi:MAG TPA: hypothetical protein PLQ19_00070 [Aeromicrobium sp.]|nr:hypothetical protein [Aeromicrobium sp.]